MNGKVLMLAIIFLGGFHVFYAFNRVQNFANVITLCTDFVLFSWESVLLSFKVGLLILSFSKKNLLPSQLLKDRGGQDGDQDHQTLRVPKESCVLWARLLFWKKITPYPCLLFFYQTYFPNKYFFSWWVGIATDTFTTSNFGNIFEKYRIKLWPNLMR